MSHVTLKLLTIERQPDDGPIDVTFEWNNETYAHQFSSQAAMVALADAPIETVADAAKWILTAWRTMDAALLDDNAVLQKPLAVADQCVQDPLITEGALLRWTCPHP